MASADATSRTPVKAVNIHTCSALGTGDIKKEKTKALELMFTYVFKIEN